MDDHPDVALARVHQAEMDRRRAAHEDGIYTTDTPAVQAVRPAVHGGYPDPGHPTVDDRLAAYLRGLDTGETVRVGYVPGSDSMHPQEFAAIAYHGADCTFGASPLAAIDRMLTENGG